MTDAAPTLPARAPLRARPGGEPRFARAGLLLVLSLAVTLPALGLDPREVQGERVWLKPIRFQAALAVYLLTLAVFARWLPAGLTARPAWRAFAAAVVLACAAEIAWIAGAAAAGTTSHFNMSTPLMAALYPLMGVLAVLLASASLVMGLAILRDRACALAPALRHTIGLGLVLTFALTVPVAMTLSQQSGPLVGAPVTGAEVPLLGWSREVGDLRAPHFLATHALHAVPLAGLALAAVLPARRALPAVWTAAALYALLVAGAFAGALAGAPLIPA
jgi:hypothetical protein